MFIWTAAWSLAVISLFVQALRTHKPRSPGTVRDFTPQQPEASPRVKSKPSISPLAGDVQINSLALVVQHVATNRVKAKGMLRSSRQLKACEKTLVLLAARVLFRHSLPRLRLYLSLIIA